MEQKVGVRTAQGLLDYLEAVLGGRALVRDARKFASERHMGQTRKGGGPYMAHPERVAGHVARNKRSSRLAELRAAALLHDTVEDTGTTIEEIRDRFGDLVASLVGELTSDDRKLAEVGKARYLTQKLLGMSDWGLVIKLADRLDNVSDLPSADEAFRRRYVAETEEILSALTRDRRLTGAQRRLVNQIRKKLARLE